MSCRTYSLAIAAIVAIGLPIMGLADSASAQEKPKIAILGLEVTDSGQGIDGKTTKLAKDITAALRRRPGTGVGPYRLAPNSEKDLLEMKLLSGCSDEKASCMAQIARDLKAGAVMYGKIEKLPTAFKVTLNLLDLENPGRVRTKPARIAHSDASTSQRITEWSRKLYNQMTGVPNTGELAITTNVTKGTVYIGGKPNGTINDNEARISGLKAGKHKVEIRAEGHERFSTTVAIRAGETAKLSATLKIGALEGPTGPTDTGDSRGIWRIGAIAGGAATLASGVALVVFDQQRRSKLDDANTEIERLRLLGIDTGMNNACAAPGLNTNTDLATLKKICDDGESKASLATAFIVATSVLGVATAVSFYIGYLSGPSASPSAGGSESGQERADNSRGSAAARNFRIAPTVTPEYLGGALTFDF